MPQKYKVLPGSKPIVPSPAKPGPGSIPASGYDALITDINSKISEARRVLQDEEDTLHGPDVWCLQAEIAALEDLLKRAAVRTAAHHNAQTDAR